MENIEEKMDDACSWRMEWSVCRVCGARNRNKTYRAKEMMYGSREEFDYFICDSCKCMQIAHIPEDMGKYYPNMYYSFDKRKNIGGYWNGRKKGTEIYTAAIPLLKKIYIMGTEYILKNVNCRKWKVCLILSDLEILLSICQIRWRSGTLI